MKAKLFPWVPDPLFSSGIMELRSDKRIRREVAIGRASEGAEISCYRLDSEFKRQQKTYLLGGSEPESLAVAYEEALLRAEEEGYEPTRPPDRPKANDVREALCQK